MSAAAPLLFQAYVAYVSSGWGASVVFLFLPSACRMSRTPARPLHCRGKVFSSFFPFFLFPIALTPISLSLAPHGACRRVSLGREVCFSFLFFSFLFPPADFLSLSPFRALTTITTVSAVVAPQTRSCHLGSLSVRQCHTCSVCRRVHAPHSLILSLCRRYTRAPTPSTHALACFALAPDPRSRALAAQYTQTQPQIATAVQQVQLALICLRTSHTHTPCHGLATLGKQQTEPRKRNIDRWHRTTAAPAAAAPAAAGDTRQLSGRR